MHPTWKQYLNEENDRCWFCQKPGCDEFDTEFDTFLHIECLKQALNHPDPDHRREAEIMDYLLEEEDSATIPVEIVIDVPNEQEEEQ